jgi:hypothetical protein
MVAVVANNVQCIVGGNNGVFEWFLMKLGLRVGYKVLLILLAIEQSRDIQNGMKSNRRSLSQQKNIVEHSRRGGNLVGHGGRARNPLLKCMTVFGSILQRNCLEMGRRGKKVRGYTLCKQQDNESENDAHVKE